MIPFDAKLEIVLFGNRDVIATSCPTECIADYICRCDGLMCEHDYCSCDGWCQREFCSCNEYCDFDLCIDDLIGN